MNLRTFFLVLVIGVAPLARQAAPSASGLSLAQAQAQALQHRPRLQAALATAAAAAQAALALRSQYLPQLTASLTGVGADSPSRIAAGGLNNPVIYSRYANGLSFTQLISNFGRTGALVKSSRLQAEAQAQTSVATRAQVLLQVDQAYFNALQAQAVLRVANQAVQERQLIARQVGVLAQNKLRSDLDVSFAKVNLAQAQLLLSQAQSGVSASLADLALAMGVPSASETLRDEPLPEAPNQDLAALVAEALQHRPELAAAGFQTDAARAYAQAQRDLWHPTVSAMGAAGFTPTGNVALPRHYAAAGINLSIPLFNGGLFSAESAEAKFQAEAADHQAQELQDQIAHDVQVAWLAAKTANQQLALTRELQQQSALAMQLAQSRYQLGLGTIVELSQAQLNQTQADIAQAQAQYQFQLATAGLNFQLGLLR